MSEQPTASRAPERNVLIVDAPLIMILRWLIGRWFWVGLDLGIDRGVRVGHLRIMRPIRLGDVR